jgi:Sec-independent protein translocase protein TatA
MMEILGVGGMEMIALLLIMLIVAGPKRMIQWSYVAGQYVAKIRQMWSETAAALQQELDQSGIDVQVPRQIPTRQSLQREINRSLSSAGQPIRNSVNGLKAEVENAAAVPVVPAVPTVVTPPKPVEASGDSYGAWSQNR